VSAIGPGRAVLPPFLPSLLLLLLLAGCASPAERFYTLSPVDTATPAANRAAYRVAVGPVTVPALVDRPQMVLRAGPERVTLAEQSRWAGPLRDNIAYVVAGNLERLLGEALVAADSQNGAVRPDYRVLLDIDRFDSTPGDAATLQVLWTVTASKDGHATSGRALIREPVAGPEIEALVAAHNRALAAVSRQIAVAIENSRRAFQAAPGVRGQQAQPDSGGRAIVPGGSR
jgi:uncharacterized lipoprotein YmbA